MKKRFRVDIPQRGGKIAIIGYSGSGKSTLAVFLGEKYGLPVLHVDTIHFLPGWVEREPEDERGLMRDFLDENSENGWVIDGNYLKLEYERRMNEADLIVFLSFNRFSCFLRAYKRSRKYKNKVRDSIAPGCEERFDRAFCRWILKEGRTKPRRQRYYEVVEKHRDKCMVIRNQIQLDRFKKACKPHPEKG